MQNGPSLHALYIVHILRTYDALCKVTHQTKTASERRLLDHDAHSQSSRNNRKEPSNTSTTEMGATRYEIFYMMADSFQRYRLIQKDITPFDVTKGYLVFESCSDVHRGARQLDRPDLGPMIRDRRWRRDWLVLVGERPR